ncbi:replicative DNA helicase [Thiorhodospira sibirica]|uniref:replicative DNA helicase n=1 Tax=Thiorhodospira sibirica TaxID=154347 RepID=UPI00022C0475|nr:replicative DNA helicase [Thiorhodospira sibirica]
MEGAAPKVPPHSMEAEQAVLGGLMLENSAWDTIADRVSEVDFYRYDHRLIFRAITELASRNTPFDAITLSEYLEKCNLLEDAGGLPYLGRLAHDVPSAANIGAYADIVRDRSVLRQLIDAGSQIAESAFNPKGRDTRSLLDEAERLVFAIAEKGTRANQGFRSMRTLLNSTIAEVEMLHERDDPITGLSTGYYELDTLTSGLQGGDLVIVAGRPSMGKTTFAMNIAEFAALNKQVAVAIFSMEMPAEQLVLRMISSLGRIQLQGLRTGKLEEEDWPRLTSIVSLLSEAPIFIDDSPALSPTEVRARTRRLVREQKSIGLVVIDYLQLMQLPGNKENRATEIAEISRSLKALAKEMRVPVIALSQLNRSLEQRPNKRPVMSDLRECVSGDTPVVLADGQRVPIASLVGQSPWVLARNPQGVIEAALAQSIWPVGVRAVLRLDFASGRQLRCTPEHRVLTPHGFVEVQHLRPGEGVALVDESGLGQIIQGRSSEPAQAVRWDALVSQAADGVAEVFDICVPGHACWLADGLISHNSGGIEQDADVIAFVYRDEVYDKDSADKGVAEIIIGKQRNGPIGTVRLSFVGHFARFDNYIPEVYTGEGF